MLEIARLSVSGVAEDALGRHNANALIAPSTAKRRAMGEVRMLASVNAHKRPCQAIQPAAHLSPPAALPWDSAGPGVAHVS